MIRYRLTIDAAIGRGVILRTMKRPALALGFGIVAFMLIGADSCDVSGGSPAGSSPQSGTISIKAGQPMSYQGRGVEVADSAPAPVDASALESPPAGQECLKVDVKLINDASQEWLIPLSEMTLVDANGQKYQSDNGLATCATSDNIDSLVTGGHAGAAMYFLVPSSGHLDFNWTPTLSGVVFQSPLR